MSLIIFISRLFRNRRASLLSRRGFVSTGSSALWLTARWWTSKKKKKKRKKKKRIFVVLLSASFRQVRKTIRARDTEPTNDADSFQFLRCRRFVGKDDEERVKDGLWVGDSLTPAAREAFMHADVCTFYILRRRFCAAKPRFQRCDVLLVNAPRNLKKGSILMVCRPRR